MYWPKIDNDIESKIKACVPCLKTRQDPEKREGDEVMVKDYRVRNEERWREARIVRRLGKVVYMCQLPAGQIWKRHVNQIILRQVQSEAKADVDETDYSFLRVPSLPPKTSVAADDSWGLTVPEGADVIDVPIPGGSVDPLDNNASNKSVTNVPTGGSGRGGTRPSRRSKMPERFRDCLMGPDIDREIDKAHRAAD
ncbi:hypothetical protein NQ315_002070 [Exocentrus adspersus]|uniref:Integrase zinc-binding domain-containing protein n=1 Tax=Exocentrus adspersus TaxID=1586481 RepID=A0AAV8V582_9CUCU|nr:hypothetical protein NQ315_002070 [Exocentrus adspersus]